MNLTKRNNRATNQDAFASDLFIAGYIIKQKLGTIVVFVDRSDMRKSCACLPIAVHTTCGVDPAKIHILVLDRNPKSAHSIGQILKPIGYQVFVTTHQSEAVSLPEEYLLHVLVTAFQPDAFHSIPPLH